MSIIGTDIWVANISIIKIFFLRICYSKFLFIYHLSFIANGPFWSYWNPALIVWILVSLKLLKSYNYILVANNVLINVSQRRRKSEDNRHIEKLSMARSQNIDNRTNLKYKKRLSIITKKSKVAVIIRTQGVIITRPRKSIHSGF
jgi:hypothetical protein